MTIHIPKDAFKTADGADVLRLWLAPTIPEIQGRVSVERGQPTLSMTAEGSFRAEQVFFFDEPYAGRLVLFMDLRNPTFVPKGAEMKYEFVW